MILNLRILKLKWKELNFYLEVYDFLASSEIIGQPSSTLIVGSFCRICVLSTEIIQHVLNPNETISTTLLSRERNMVFRMYPVHLDSFLQSTSVFVQTLFRGRKTATSNDWVRWFIFRRRGIKVMLFSWHAIINSSPKWQPIMIFCCLVALIHTARNSLWTK